MRYALFYNDEKQAEIIYDRARESAICGPAVIRAIDIAQGIILTDFGKVAFEMKADKKFEASVQATNRFPYNNVVFCDYSVWDTREIAALPRIVEYARFESCLMLRKDFFLQMSPENTVSIQNISEFKFSSSGHQLMELIKNNTNSFSEPGGFAVLHNAYVFSPSMIRLQSGQFLKDTLHYANWKCNYSDGCCHSRLNGAFYFNDHSKLHYKYYEKMALILSPLSYTHFIVQNVPALYNLSVLLKKGLISREDIIIIASSDGLINSVGRYFLELFGLTDVPIIDPGTEGIDCFGANIVLVSSHEGNFPPFQYDVILHDVFYNACPDNPPRSEEPLIIIASRKDVGNRRGILNEEELKTGLEKVGYEVIVVEGSRLTFAEQRNLFSRAALVIGPHGANMVNAIFAPKSCPIIELVNDDVGVNVFWYMNLFHRLRRKYVLLNFPSPGNGWVAPFEVDVDQVVKTAVNAIKWSGTKTRLIAPNRT